MVTRSGVKLCYKYNLGAEIISSQTQYQEHLGGEKKRIWSMKTHIKGMFLRVSKHTSV